MSEWAYGSEAAVRQYELGEHLICLRVQRYQLFFQASIVLNGHVVHVSEHESCIQGMTACNEAKERALRLRHII